MERARYFDKERFYLFLLRTILLITGFLVVLLIYVVDFFFFSCKLLTLGVCNNRSYSGLISLRFLS